MMLKQKSKLEAISVLASYATLRSVFDSKQYQNIYQLLLEFIKYVVISEKKHVFTSADMKKMLKESFGFDLPEAVVRTAIKGATFIQSKHGQFVVTDLEYQQDDQFEKRKMIADKEEHYLAECLLEYAQKTRPDVSLNSEIMMQELMTYLLEPDQEGGYSDYRELISKFILAFEDNERIQSNLNSIREGCVLYLGLNNNIAEVGRITNRITIYLATEILFSLSGYNGVIYKDLAMDFINLVKKANSHSSMIKLSYFPETQKEIEDFFYKAEKIVEKKEPYLDRPAMKAIINGCSSNTDVAEKQADFFHNLQLGFGITCDEKTRFYSEELDAYNLESMEIDPQYEEGLRYVSHINKLRRGRMSTTELDAGYLYITNTISTLIISRQEAKKANIEERDKYERMFDYAVSLDHITNMLWYKLGSGFGNEGYPKNVQAVLKAKSLLSSKIIQQISKSFEKAKEDYESGDLTKEKAASRIIVLRKKPTLPEELTMDNIDKSLDFTDDYLDQYENDANKNAAAIAEMASELEYMRTKDQQHEREAHQNAATMAHMAQELEEMHTKDKQREAENNALEARVAAFEREKAEQQKEKQRKENIKSFVKRLIVKSIIIIVLICVFAWITLKLQKREPESSILSMVCSLLGLLVDSAAVFGLLYSIIKKDCEKCFQNPKQESTEYEEK